ncbi:hypothetical protein OQJ59_16445 [Microbulbifer thermotolerans]|uniref:hypothetical protein n=1 Tax=Microbulbifer thermotolerans TaxID=252514 RepID=UPI00224A65E8|nr:hypothetical protein [Microbulbifer thermotolerans]MCX2843201.1 hypothetical protein [Microbulbifer thermotolerans]
MAIVQISHNASDIRRKRSASVKIIDGRRVKVADKGEVKAVSRRLIAKHARAMEILKDK